MSREPWQCACRTAGHELCGGVRPTRRGHWMTTYTGNLFWPMDPKLSEISIEDIAHALSNLCRFGGHCRSFYSVAQHSVLVSERLTLIEEKRWGLLHDASEAYMQDLVPAIKMWLHDYKNYERELQDSIFEKFGLLRPAPIDAIKKADLEVLATEARDLMPPGVLDFWRLGAEPLQDLTVTPWSPEDAKKQFIDAFRELWKGSYSV